MKKLLKKYGLHHGLPLLAIIWIVYMFSPILGMAVSLIGIGWYGGKEYQEWLQRGSMEWPDVITPVSLASISLYFMSMGYV